MASHLLYRIVLPLGILAGGIVALLWLRQQREPPAKTTRPPEPAAVRTTVVGPVVDELTLEASGVVAPLRVTQLAAAVPGRVIAKEKVAESGRFVGASALLLTIDRKPYRLAVAARQAETARLAAEMERLALEETQTQQLLKLAAQQRALSEKEVRRQQDLLRRKATSSAEIDAARQAVLRDHLAELQLRNVLQSIPARRQSLRADQQAAVARQRQAEHALRRTRIVAPHPGLVVADHVEPGDYVEAGDKLLVLADTSAYEVRAPFRIDQLYWLWSADRRPFEPSPQKSGPRYFEIAPRPATVTFTASDDQRFTWKGVLDAVDGTGIDEQTQTVTCRVRISEPKRLAAKDGPPALVSGMFVTVTVRIRPQIGLLRLPHQAVQPDGRAWVVEDQKLRVRDIRVVHRTEDHALLRAKPETLRPGDRIVITPLSTAYDGMPVREVAPP